MSLENFEGLTDVELRRKLQEYGFPNIPITETSRGFLVKKLKNHIKNLKSRKHSANVCVTLRAKQEQENLVTRDNDWSEHNMEKNTREVSDSVKLDRLEQTATIDSVTQSADEIYQPGQNIRMRNQTTNQLLSMSSDNNSNGYFGMIYKVCGLQEIYTNSVWWSFTLFLFVITFIYMMKTNNQWKHFNEDGMHYVTCERLHPGNPLLRPPLVCIDKARLEPALAIVRNLMEQLRIRAERHFCYDHAQPEAMSVTEFTRSLLEEGSTVDMRSVRDAQYLITCNPQWNIDMVDQRGSPAIFNGVDKILSNRNTFFVLKQLYLPLPCSLLLKARTFISFVGHVALLMCVLILIFLSYLYVHRIQVQRLRAVQNLLNNIIRELRQRAIESDSPDEREVVVNHLRDQLIPMSNRECELKFWKEALEKLEANNSCVRFDVKIRDGEELRTIRWIDNNTQLIAEGLNTASGGTSEVETNC
ncbi:inner nuclear membrane protein Man1-like [Anastrepha ludens]|uniref:inner nuclear membrane protein Man1-like n=1 Tax=Anastrepha ludens TaxID=28586 RepID=UPI0023AEE495|nr:inner nuclear membrane protein Man1-like [Anastrepha ludens]XP_053963252.1 inner nuclear membrane protein Man1-like [Anastrepha ludens]